MPLTVATAVPGTRYRNPKGVLLVYVGPSKSAPGLYDVRVEETGRVIVAPPTQQLFEIDAAELAGIEIAPLRNQPRDVVAAALAALSDAALEALADGDTRPFVQTLCTAEFARREAILPVKPAITVIAQGDIEIEEIDLVPVKPIAVALAEIEGETIYDPAEEPFARPVEAPVLPSIAAGLADAGATVVESQADQDALDAAEALRTPAPLAPVKRPRKTPEEKAEAARLKALKAELKGGTITGEKPGPEIVEPFITDYQRAGSGDLACPDCGAGIEWGCGPDIGDRGSAYCYRSSRVTVRSAPTPGGFGSGACEWTGTVIRDFDGGISIVGAGKPIPALVAAMERIAADPVVASIEAALTEAHADAPAVGSKSEPAHARRYVAEADREGARLTGTWYVADEALRGDVTGDLYASPDVAANERGARAEADRLEAACCIDAASDLCDEGVDWLSILSAVEAGIEARPDLGDDLGDVVRVLRAGAEGSPVVDQDVIAAGLAHARALLRPAISEARATLTAAPDACKHERPDGTSAIVAARFAGYGVCTLCRDDSFPFDEEAARLAYSDAGLGRESALTPEAEDLRYLAQRGVILADGDLALFRRLVGSVRENSAALVGCRNKALVDAAHAWEVDHANRETVARKLADRLASIRGGKRPPDASGTRTLREHGPVEHRAEPVTVLMTAALSAEGRAAVETAQARLRAQAAALLVLADALPGYRAAIEAEEALAALGIPSALGTLSVPR